MTYLTNGTRLFEVLSDASQRNYGRLGGFLRCLIVRDCMTEEEGSLSGLELLMCREVTS